MRWVGAFVLLMAVSASWFLRMVLPTMIPVIVRDLGISLTRVSWIFTAQSIGMGFGAVVAGVLFAFGGARWGLPVIFALAGIAGSASAAASNEISLVALRFLTGMGVGGVMAGVVHASREWFPSPVRAGLIGMAMMTGQITILMANPLFTFLAREASWRVLVGACGAPMLMAAAFFAVMGIKPEPDDPNEPQPAASAGFLAAGAAALGLLFATPVSVLASSWMATILRMRNDRFVSQSYAALGLNIGGFLGAFVATAILVCVLLVIKQPGRARAMLIGIWGLGLLVSAAGAIRLPSESFWLLGGFLMAAFQGWMVLLYALVADYVPRPWTGAAAAAGGLGIYVMGAVISAVYGNMMEGPREQSLFLIAAGCAAVGWLAAMGLAWFAVEAKPAATR